MKNLIAKIRKELGITQEDLADKTGVTRQTIIALEQNRYNPSLGLAFSITKTLKKHAIEEVFQIGK
jgi:putative transcriptional regulator